MHLDDARTALYRLYDAHGRLLYIGITHELEQRWSTHASTKAWWSKVVRKTIEWHENRGLAEAAEKTAIREERPMHNRANSPWIPGPRGLERDEATIGEARSNLSELLASARLLRRCVLLVGRGRKQVGAIVPAELGQLIQQVGGVDRAAALLHASLPCPAEPEGP